MERSGQFDDTNNALYLSKRITAIGTSEKEAMVGSSRADGRQFVRITNVGSQNLYFGPASTIYTDKDILYPDQSVTLPIQDIAVMMMTSTGTTEAIVQEIG